MLCDRETVLCAHFWNCLKLRRSKDVNAVILYLLQLLLLLLFSLHIPNRTLFYFFGVGRSRSPSAIPSILYFSMAVGVCVCVCLGFLFTREKVNFIAVVFVWGREKKKFPFNFFDRFYFISARHLPLLALILPSFLAAAVVLAHKIFRVGGVKIYGAVVCSLNYWLNNMK